MAGTDKAERQRATRMVTEPRSAAKRPRDYDLTGDKKPKRMSAASAEAWNREHASEGKGVRNLFGLGTFHGDSFMTGVDFDKH
jgi:hypothetical protein